MWRYALAALVAVTAILASAPPAIVEGLAAWQISPESLRSPAAVNSAQPQLSVSDRGVLLSWIGAPLRVDDGGSLGREDVEVLADGAALATWIEFADQRAQFRARRIDRSGARSPAVTIAGIAGNRTSGYPRAAMARGELVFAWTESADGALRVRTATAALPAAGATAR